MMLRVVELLVAWYRGYITDGEFLSEAWLAMAMASKEVGLWRGVC